MKRVSFKIAKALKEAGYPQGWGCDEHYCLESEGVYGYKIGDIVSANAIHKNCLEAMSAPTYLEVWLWLWRKKKQVIDLQFHTKSNKWNVGSDYYSDPEEAIISAIEFLVTSGLIK